MNITKALCASVLISVSAAAFATEYNITPGGMTVILKQDPIADGTLILHGSLDARDLYAVAGLPLDMLDLSDVDISAVSARLPVFLDRHGFVADEIPDYLFYGSSLRGIRLPASVRRVGEGAFAESALVTFEGAEGLETIADHAFRNCRSLTSAKLPSTLAELGKGVFAGASALAESDLSATHITVLPERTFDGCESLTSVSLPQTLKTVGPNAFNGSAVTAINIPAGVSAEPFAFSGAAKLQSVTGLITNPSDAAGVFYGDSELKEVSNPLSPVPELAYAGCSSIPVSEITKDAGTIGDFALYGINARTVVLAEGVTSLGEGVLGNNPDMTMIDCVALQNNIPAVTESTFSHIDKKRVQVMVWRDYMDNWQAAEYWNEFEIVPHDVKAEEILAGAYSLSYSDGVLHITASEPLLSVEVYDVAGHTLARVNPGDIQADIPVATSSQILIVRSKTESGQRDDKLILSSR